MWRAKSQGWIPEGRAQCLAQWNTGRYSMGELAKQFSTTRHSIAGLLYRSKLNGFSVIDRQSELIVARIGNSKIPSRKGAIKFGNGAKPRQRVRKSARKPALIVIDKNFSPPLRKSLFDLGKNECHYPFGDKNFAFCGYPTADNQSFCAVHHQMCWVSPTR